MGDESESFYFHEIFVSALQDYEKQTGIPLDKHPLAEQLQNCDSVESVTAVLREQVRAFREFQGSDRIMKLLTNAVSVLCKLSATTDTLGGVISLSFPPGKAIHAGLAILLAVIKDVSASYDALVELLESIEHFLRRLDIYTKISPTPAMTEIVVKIMVELLSTLALATKQIQQGRPKKFIKKLFGENDVEAVLRRLDRLTQDEARTTAAQTLQVVYGLVQNMRVVMDDGKASVDGVRDALEIMQQIASDMNKSRRDKLQTDVASWLSPPDPWKNHNIACKSRHSRTAEWFIQSNVFLEWKSFCPGSLLWIHGKPGAGKTVLCSTVIHAVNTMRKSGLASLAFFYCDFREDQKKDLRGLISSLLVQLCHQSDSYCAILSHLYSAHASGKQHPSDGALVQCLQDILKHPGQPPTFIVLDALDECPNTTAIPSPREEVLNLLDELVGLHLPSLRIFVTSRPESDIKLVLDPLTSHTVSLHDERGQIEDICDYIQSVIKTHPKNRKWKAEDKQLVIDVLTKKADGMFRWVYCQVVYICGCLPGRIRHALDELPDTLDETYERTLREINKAHWEFAHRLLQCVTVACRPLRVEELAEILAFDFKAGQIPNFHEDWRLEDPVDAVLSTCSNLLAVVNVEDSSVVQFSHFSVKEFLTSTRLAEASDTICRRHHVSMTVAHTLLARACLGLLLHLDEAVTRDSLEKFSLAEYAARYWVDHARFENVSQTVEDGTKQLFDPRKPHFFVWVWIYGPVFLHHREYVRAKRPQSPDGTPLHYAASCGFDAIIKFLVTEHSQDVNSRDTTSTFAATPLQMASYRGHVEVVRVLLEHGADVTAPDNEGVTPLHFAEDAAVARVLLEHGAEVMAQDFSAGDTPLHWASSGGHVDAARVLLEHGANVTAQNWRGITPLHVVLEEGHAECARLLLEYGADVEAQDKDGQTPLFMGSGWSESEQVARVLLEHGADVTARDKDGKTPLHRALEYGLSGMIRVLVENGADVTAQDSWGQTALDLALAGRGVARVLLEHCMKVTAQFKSGQTALHLVSSRGRAEETRFLLECGADAAAQDKSGQTPLHRASWWGSAEVARILLEHGVDVAAQDKSQSTALHLASGWGNAEVARVLLDHGVDVAAQDKNGWTALLLASRMGHAEVASVLLEHGMDKTTESRGGSMALRLASYWGHEEVARVLLEHGVDATTQDKNGWTALHVASWGGHAENARVLLEYSVDPATQDKSGSTALHVASRDGHAEIARVLLEYSVDAAIQDKSGSTALHVASRGGHAKIARVLLDHGVDVTAQERNGLTALHLASRGGRAELTSVLLEHGADTTTQDNKGSTALHLASRGGHVKVARMLLEHGADARMQDESGSTALDYASRGGRVARVLVKHSVDLGADSNRS